MKIELERYDPSWAKSYLSERDRLLKVLGDEVVAIEHIGSTSIPGISAKPIIDVQVGVKNLHIFEKSGSLTRMADAGYEYLPHFERDAPFRRFFVRNENDIRKANIHIVSANHPWFRRHIFFRDYLRHNVDARMRYENFKQDLVGREWKDSSEYAQAKTGVIIRLEDEAYDALKLTEDLKQQLRSTRV